MKKRIMALITALIVIMTAMISVIPASAATVTDQDELQIVNWKRVDDTHMAIVFNKKVVMDVTGIFAWFGHEIEAEGNNQTINMDYGTSSTADYELSEDGLVLTITYKKDTIDKYFDPVAAETEHYYFVIHQNYDGAISTMDYEVLHYDPVDLYQQNGTNYIGVLGFASLVDVRDIENNEWKYKLDVETVAEEETTAAETTKKADETTEKKEETTEKAEEVTTVADETTSAPAAEESSSSTGIIIAISAVAVVIIAVLVIIIIKKKK